MFTYSLFSGRRQFIFSIFIFLFSIGSQAQVFFNDLEVETIQGNWIGLNSIDSGSAYSGLYFSKTDSLHPYGLGIEQALPNYLNQKNTVISIGGYVRTNNNKNNPLYVITVVGENNETLLWKGIHLGSIMIVPNQWYYFSDSIVIPGSLMSGSKIKAYLWNENRNYSTCLDDLKFEFEELNNPTFLPKITKSNYPNSEQKILFNNSFYSVLYSDENSTLSIHDVDGNEIIQNISYYSNREIKNEKTISQKNLKFKNKKSTTGGTYLRFKTKDDGSSLTLTLKCSNNKGKIEFTIDDRYRKKQEVSRESIAFEYSQPIAEVYCNNRKLDDKNFQQEYWLDNEGVKIGKGKSSAIIYHVPEISSLQLDTKNDMLFANLDYETDHPFFRFPLNPDSTNWKKEESTSSYTGRNKRVYSFSINIGLETPTIPRFMKNPAGYEATYIWTEHADYSDIRTNRATYFGSENIIDADSATGGFVYYNIPITKSVFYDNPDSIANFEASHGVFNSLESTILTDSDFSDFLFQIAKKGSDICLHTPEQYTTTSDRFEEALLYMQINYGSPSWIDHGNNNGPQNNREDLICDATLKKSPFYAIDKWKRYGIKYLHNAYYEELSTYKDWQFDSSLEKPFSGYGDFFPKPDYYQHYTKTQNLYHWTTTSAIFIYEPYLWDYLFNTKKLTSLVDNWYVEINHVYPAWVDPKKGMWTYDSDSIIIAQQGLNQSLANLASLRDEGRLNITTIADYLDYRTAIDNLEYELLPDGRVIITNNNDFTIEGLSMAVRANAVTVNQLIPSYKKIGDDIIFWFDLTPGESGIIRMIE